MGLLSRTWILIGVVCAWSGVSADPKRGHSTTAQVESPAELVSRARQALDGALIGLPLGNLGRGRDLLRRARMSASAAGQRAIADEAELLEGLTFLAQGLFARADSTLRRLLADPATDPGVRYRASIWLPEALRRSRQLWHDVASPDWLELPGLGPDPQDVERSMRPINDAAFREAVADGQDGKALVAERLMLDGPQELAFARSMAMQPRSPLSSPQTRPVFVGLLRQQAETLVSASSLALAERWATARGCPHHLVTMRQRLAAAEQYLRADPKSTEGAKLLESVQAQGDVGIALAHSLMASLAAVDSGLIQSLGLPLRIHTFNAAMADPPDPSPDLRPTSVDEARRRQVLENLSVAGSAARRTGSHRLVAHVALQEARARLTWLTSSDDTGPSALRAIRASLGVAMDGFAAADDRAGVRHVRVLRTIAALEAGDAFAAQRALFPTPPTSLSIASAGEDGITLAGGALLRVAAFRMLSMDRDPITGTAALRLSESLFAAGGAKLAAAHVNLTRAGAADVLDRKRDAVWSAARALEQIDAAFAENRYRHIDAGRRAVERLSILARMADAIAGALDRYSADLLKLGARVDDDLDSTTLAVSGNLGADLRGDGSLSDRLRLAMALQIALTLQYQQASQNSIGRGIDPKALRAAKARMDEARTRVLQGQGIVKAVLHHQFLRSMLALIGDRRRAVHTGLNEFPATRRLLQSEDLAALRLVVLRESGRCDEAVEMTDEMVAQAQAQRELRDELGMGVSGVRSATYTGLAAAVLCKDFEAASRYYEALAATLPEPQSWAEVAPADRVWEWLDMIAEWHIAESQLQNARRFHELAIEAYERWRAASVTGSLRSHTNGQVSMMYASAAHTLVRTGAGSVDLGQAFDLAEQVKGRGFTESIAADRLAAAVDGNRPIAHWYALAIRHADAVRRAASAPADDRAAAVAEVQRLEASLEAEERRRRAHPDEPESRALALVRGERGPQLQRILQRLPEDALFVSYLIERKALLVFSIDHTDGLRAVRVPFQTADLAPDIDPVGSHRPASGHILLERLVVHGLAPELANAGSEAALDDTVRRLSRLLVEPIADRLKGRRRVIISPHGVLHRVPFEVLESNGRLLLDTHEVGYVSNGAMLGLVPAGERRAASRALFWSAPDVRQGSPAERRALEQFFDLVAPDDVGSSMELLEYLEGAPGLIHLAMHGRAAMDGGQIELQLGPEGQSISSTDLFDLDLRGTGLVTLTACDTLATPENVGDEHTGLVRGLRYAGARQVVASLWRLDGHTSGELMADFYGAIKEGRDAVAAMTIAKRAYRERHRGDIEKMHPHYWATLTAWGI